MRTPTYEELLERRRGGGVPPSALALRIMGMKPGDVLAVGEGDAKTAQRVSQLVTSKSGHVRRHSPHKYVVRSRDGHVYVLCLRPEDANGAKP